MPSISSLRPFLLAFSLFGLAGAAALAADPPPDLRSIGVYGAPLYNDEPDDFGSDSNGNFYLLLDQGSPHEALVRKFTPQAVPAYTTKLRYEPGFRGELRVDKAGSVYTIGAELNDPSGTGMVAIRALTPSGAIKWGREIGPAPGGTQIPLLEIDEGNELVVVVTGGSGSLLMRLDSETGATIWSRTVSGSNTFGFATGAGLVVVPDSLGGDVRLQAFSLVTGSPQWTRSFDFNGNDRLVQLKFNPVTRAFYGSGEYSPTPPARTFVTCFTADGVRAWTRLSPLDYAASHILKFGPDGDIYTAWKELGAEQRLIRIRVDGVFRYAVVLPSELMTLGRKQLAVDEGGAAYVTGRTRTGELMVARVGDGVVDWSIAETLPYWSPDPINSPLGISLAPAGTLTGSFFVPARHIETGNGSGATDVRLYRFGPQ